MRHVEDEGEWDILGGGGVSRGNDLVLVARGILVVKSFHCYGTDAGGDVRRIGIGRKCLNVNTDGANHVDSSEAIVVKQ